MPNKNIEWKSAGGRTQRRILLSNAKRETYKMRPNMRTKKLNSRVFKGLVLALSFASICGQAGAVFQDPYWSARVAALGGAFTAVADDPAGVFYNAAATTQIKRRAGSFSYARLFTGLDGVKL